MSPGQQRRIQRMTEEAQALGMTLAEWRIVRANSNKVRASTDPRNGAEDRRFRLKHPHAMYAPGVTGMIHRYTDTAVEGMRRDFNDYLMYGSTRR